MKKNYQVKGMSCAICKNTIEKQLNKLDGVRQCQVNLLENDMIIDFDENKINIDKIAATVDHLGYELIIGAKKEKSDPRKLKLIISSALMILLMYFSMGHMLSLPFTHIDHFRIGIIELVIATLIYLLEGRYFVSGFKSLLNLNPNMDALVAISTGVSYIYSIYALLKAAAGDFSHHYYFETGAMILLIVSIGKYIEGINKEKTTKAIRLLATLRPKEAAVLLNDEIKIVRVEDLNIGDLILTKAGEAIAQDGIVVNGEADVDESMITGESIPVSKKINDEVVGGTIALNGALTIKITKRNEDSILAKIIEMTRIATTEKIPIQRFADRVSAFFVPGVIVISLITFIIWYFVSHDVELSMNYALSVLVISCPCALGLATPSAIMVANGVSAENGILIKNSEVLEIAHGIKTVIMDKTGTITENRPQIIKEIKLAPSFEKIAVSLESHSNHPIAKAVIERWPNVEKIAFDKVEEISGQGIKAFVKGKTYLAGNEKLMISHQVPFDPMLLEDARTNLFSYIMVAENDQLLGLLYLSDVIKPSSIDAIRELKQMGIKTIMCTGDNALIAQKIADQAKVDAYQSEVKPEDKYSIVEKYRSEGTLAMVGDGINDAIALSGADVSFAVASGSDIAFESSDLVLMKNDLSDIPFLINLSARTMMIIKQNLFWALFYNAIFIPLAAGAFSKSFGLSLNPMIGAATMSVSSIVVLSNALRIKKIKRNKTDKEEMKMTKTVVIDGMMCQHCVKHVKDALESLGLNAEVSLENKQAVVKGNASDEMIVKAVSDAGYEVKEIK